MLVCATRCRLAPGNAICRSEPDEEEQEEEDGEMRSVRGAQEKDETGSRGACQNSAIHMIREAASCYKWQMVKRFTLLRYRARAVMR